jgi:hypothetical protein
MLWAVPVDPYRDLVNPYVEVDPRESFVTVRECARILGCSEERVIQLANHGTLRSRGMPVQPALIKGGHRLGLGGG